MALPSAAPAGVPNIDSASNRIDDAATKFERGVDRLIAQLSDQAGQTRGVSYTPGVSPAAGQLGAFERIADRLDDASRGINHAARMIAAATPQRSPTLGSPSIDA
jgi:hypothetical protein